MQCFSGGAINIPFLDRIDLIGVVNLRDSFNRENEKVAPLWGATRNELSWGAPLDWGSGRGGVIKGVSTGPDMFAGCGNIPHLKGRIRHLKEK